ncbi:ATP-binding cassette domain-containing protein [Testudinibacter sp. TR-2022]|uniref:ribosome-associated ATPase/putative transporter RbbA n=1 Tax=Testudinibacter sp. TR-2022 TaxID=2585029 RepID=UPI0011184C16|nr:ribosome-associated ATPase/putative transporter RbbA [Testudinibacter sp. TR-2022]TNH03497.1 ATP-binding cassette domain-containing protein [Pasteurellaceae bacterium Phil31]TNH07931.1 ATP-binding cassette domain-containing protein [Testudinibacter sp. TR-2022]TNH10332.1 ATP-binding cassette domain-containing protein [Testudinibacter sp. TR-2022]TNH11640.1 ATP-binding cassette domain-containing protein [Testudinibacter sp. TR-2022]TNH20818.1 ATP-binding cassette domain-containing protein [T
MANALTLQQLCHHYDKIVALDNVSLTLPQGVTAGLIGPDGVGKSTLLSLIAGVKMIQQGTVQVLGLDQANKSDRQTLSSKIAFMPQGLGKNLYPTLSINENIDFHARLFGLNSQQRKQRIQRLLDATGLTPFADRAAGKLSGGMKQKLSLCCALVHNPELLILDEPTTGVDPLSRRQFWQLVADLRAEIEGMTVLVATAYIDEAEQFDYLLAMDDGKLLVHAPTRTVLQQSGCQNLEQAYIKLLPPDKQTQWDDSQIPHFEPDPDSPPAIEAHGLSKKFGDFTAVDNVSFSIARGEIFGFLGSNGCGKSTTMKMLTGLLDSSSGSAELLGKSVNANDMQTRKQVGYMSQAFSLYEELSVRQNLVLHAKLYQLEGRQGEAAVASALQQFELEQVADSLPTALSLGVRQRLQLAAACLHHPQVLILDEPTSGVDPAARDMFWQYLLKLSRQERITIFVSTHFMNEAQRCDRISFMDRGKVLAIGTPQALQQQKKAATLEQAFILYLEEQQPQQALQTNPTELSANTASQDQPPLDLSFGWGYWFNIIWTFAVREGKELLRDRIRLLFAIFGPVTLLLAGSWGISFDVSNLKLAVLDQDKSYQSRELITQFSASDYFELVEMLPDRQSISNRLNSGRARLVIEIPPNFGRDWLQQKIPQVGLYVDGSMPFNGENIVGYSQGIIAEYVQQLYRQQGITFDSPMELEVRFIYNQAFKSVNAISPGLIMLTLMMIPGMMTALGVVREKEIGSITNLYASPASVRQYLLGKQLPYVALSMLSYLLLVLLTTTLIGVPLKGSFWAMSLGALGLILASTAFGLLISTFVQSQVAAIFATAIISMVPALNFSGLLYPMSTLSGAGYYIGWGFPTSWYNLISLGAFTKGLGFADFLPFYAMLLLFFVLYLSLAGLLLKKQEK